MHKKIPLIKSGIFIGEIIFYIEHAFVKDFSLPKIPNPVVQST